METRRFSLTALTRPHCRIALGTPDESGGNWSSLSPFVTPANNQFASYAKDLPPAPRTDVRGMADGAALYLRFDCVVDDPRRLTPREPSAALSEMERVWVNVHPLNDPTGWLRFEADWRGTPSVTRQQLVNGECSLGAVPDRWQDSAPVTFDWRLLHGLGDRAWWVELEIPWRSIGLRARPGAIGFACGRVYATGQSGVPLNDISWPDPPRDSSLPASLECGEALIGPGAAPARLEIQSPRFGWNRARLSLGTQWPKDADTIRVRTESGEGRSIADSSHGVAGAELDFDFWLDRSLCSHLDVFQAQRLIIEATNAATGAKFYQVRLPFDRHLGICIDEPYGESGSMEPHPHRTLTRRERLLDRVARTLPRLERRNTAQGAPSDFCLADANGRVVVDLMADGAWESVAAIIEERFETAEERIVGAMLLAGQKSICNLVVFHLFFNARMEAIYKHGNFHDKMGPLSILRYGGGPPVARAVVLGRLLQQVRNPKTGQRFVTRVLSLQRDGGPKVTSRHNPFWQLAGPVGAVAIEYRGDHTLVDPTSLAVFVRDDGSLATLDEIVSNERLRVEGADRLAPTFARVSADDVRHERPNRRWSKGVFPELCADEDRPDSPFYLRYRQTPRVLVAREGAESAGLDGFVDVWGERGHRDGTVRASWNKDRLRVRVQVRGVALRSLQGADREIEEVHLAIDAAHAHMRFHHFMLGASGRKAAWRDDVGNIQTLCKHLSTENSSGIDLPDAQWTGELEAGSDGYTATFEIPWETLEVSAPPPVIGLNVWAQGRTPFYEQVFLSPPRWHIAADPFHFADLYLGDTPVTLREIDLGVPTWGANIGHAEIANASDRPVEATLQAENRLERRRALTRSPEVTVTIPAGGRTAVEFPFSVDGSEKMGTPQTIALLVRCGGKTCFAGRWGADYSGPVAVYQRYGSAVPKTPNPKPGEPDFLEKKIAYICSRLPQFQRLTTRDGAASDFVLRAEDGSAEFNLMQPGVLDRIGEYIAGRFDNDLDRILGIFYLSYAPSVGRHMSWGHRLMEGADGLSVIRGNFAGAGGNCGYHSRVFGVLACHLKLNGEYLPAHGSVAVRGHVISAVARRGSKAIVDADVGHIFLRPDGTDLATLEELRANPAVLTTAGPADLARYYTVNDDAVRIRRTMREQKPPGSFPPHAPQE